VDRAGNDLCFTHHDRDFEFDLAIDQNNPAMKWLAPLNLTRGTEQVGRDIGVEWEYSFMFPPHTDLPNGPLTQTTTVSVNGAPVTLRAPWPLDVMAVHGPVISDCGHPCGDANHSRTEFHPPTALAWLHAVPDQAGYYQLSWRMSSHATFPRDDPQQFRGRLNAMLPLPDQYKGPVVLRSETTCDYLFTDWDIDDLDSCKLFVGESPYLCDLGLMAAAFALLVEQVGLLRGATILGAMFGFDTANISSFVTACRGQPNAQLEYHGGSCQEWKSYFAANIVPASSAVSVALDSKKSAPADRPYLFGGHADLCVPSCPATGGYCGPSTNQCGFCTRGFCERPNTACGAPVPNCGGAVCQTGVCPNNGQCVAGQCRGCQPNCNGVTCASDGCGGTCGCGRYGVCRNGQCATVCPSGWHPCGDGVCVPPHASCP
jgi:hypothetical protein